MNGELTTHTPCRSDQPIAERRGSHSSLSTSMTTSGQSCPGCSGDQRRLCHPTMSTAWTPNSTRHRMRTDTTSPSPDTANLPACCGSAHPERPSHPGRGTVWGCSAAQASTRKRRSRRRVPRTYWPVSSWVMVRAGIAALCVRSTCQTWTARSTLVAGFVGVDEGLRPGHRSRKPRRPSSLYAARGLTLAGCRLMLGQQQRGRCGVWRTGGSRGPSAGLR